ncbi:hypothetical protein MMC24_007176 [Lignoscripta atroalba]|nr:hypothetical protein [Lignoscripta atroalba]
MKTTTILAALAGFTASVSAVALPATIASSDEIKVEVFPDGLPEDLIPQASGLVKRADNGVFLCTDRNFSGYCVHIVAPLYKCVPLGGDLNDLVSSVGPDYGYCFFFSANGCSDSEGHFGTFAPGYSDLSVINFNDKISSYYCNPN